MSQYDEQGTLAATKKLRDRCNAAFAKNRNTWDSEDLLVLTAPPVIAIDGKVAHVHFTVDAFNEIDAFNAMVMSLPVEHVPEPEQKPEENTASRLEEYYSSSTTCYMCARTGQRLGVVKGDGRAICGQCAYEHLT